MIVKNIIYLLKLRMRKYLFLASCIFFQSYSFAKVPVDGMISICSPYMEINDPTSYPEVFNTTNNLARPKHSEFYEAEGEKITIYGRVMDSNCTPLSDAKIFIWQANYQGYIQYPIKTPNSRFHNQKWIDPNFTGTGITTTNNLGRFSFTTIKPGSTTSVTPHIHFIVEHPKLTTLHSKFYFSKKEGSMIIDTDPDDKVFYIKDKSLIAQVSAVPGVKPGVYTIDITMHEAILEKGY